MGEGNRSFRLFGLVGVLLLVGGLLIFFGLRKSQNLSNVSQLSVGEASEGAQFAVASESGGLAISGLLPSGGQLVRVVRVVDGDTIEVDSGGGAETVRLIGIDTPETVDPRRPVGCFGKEASNETHRLLDGQSVVLEKDVSDKDKYNRLLRYVFLVDEHNNWIFINDYLVRSGFAVSSTYPPDVKYQERLKEAEKEAREGNLGLWGTKCKGA